MINLRRELCLRPIIRPTSLSSLILSLKYFSYFTRHRWGKFQHENYERICDELNTIVYWRFKLTTYTVFHKVRISTPDLPFFLVHSRSNQVTDRIYAKERSTPFIVGFPKLNDERHSHSVWWIQLGHWPVYLEERYFNYEPHLLQVRTSLFLVPTLVSGLRRIETVISKRCVVLVLQSTRYRVDLNRVKST